MLPGFRKIQKGYGLEPDVAVIRDGEGYGVIFSCNQILIPFFDPEFGRFDPGPVINLKQLTGPTGFPQGSVFF